jgi:general stress protein YciG
MAKKNPLAVGLAKLRMKSMTAEERQAVAQKGAKARNKKLTATERQEIARKAGQASAVKRWGKKK